MNKLYAIAAHFPIDGEISQISPMGSGLINDTYIIKTRQNNLPDYVLQRINTAVFTDVEMLQANIEAVTRHIRGKLEAKGETDIDRKVLRFLPADSGKTYYSDGQDYWRVMLFIPRSLSFDAVTPEHSYQAGVAFGNFEAMLADIPDHIGETIPHFHDMELRIKQLHEAVEADAINRVTGVKQLIDSIERHAHEMTKAERLYCEGFLPKRVCHCDTKVNNLLFDHDGTALCVIDLDTVMPSFVFSDYGDFLRSAANTGKEDDQDIENVNFDMSIFRAFTRGYIESARQFLLPIEIDMLPWAAMLFPYMQSVRFLTDYIDGDHYYKTVYPDHNLVRAKAQFRLFESAKEHEYEMKQFITETTMR